MHFDIVLNFLATPKNVFVCVWLMYDFKSWRNLWWWKLFQYPVCVCYVIAAGTVATRCGNPFVYNVVCVKTEKRKLWSWKMKKCYKYQVLSFISHLFCRRYRFVFFVLFSALFNFLANTSFHPLALLLPYFASVRFLLPIFNVVFILLSFGFN